MSYKADQKALQKPDELQKLGQQAVPWMEQHGRTVVYGVLGVGVLAFAMAVVNEMGRRSELAASSSFGASLRVLDREVNANATATPKPGEEPPFKSEAEKDAELVRQLTAFRAENAGRKAAANAALPLAQALVRVGKPVEALPLVDEYLKSGDETDPLRPSAFEARGYAYEAQQKYDEALAAFDQLARENKTDFMKGMGLYHRARMLAMKGDTAGAAKQFFELEAAAPGTSAARLAKERLGLLAAQGVAVPTAVVPATDAGN
jgi:tetratricopeptide (TPR) repeat protein